MRRALMFVLMVMLLTAGVWCYLPTAAPQIVVFYQPQANSGEIGVSTASTTSVLTQNGTWLAQLEKITLAPASRIGWMLGQSARTAEITLILTAPTNSAAPSPRVQLSDEQGNSYLASVPACDYTAGLGWRCSIIVPKLANTARQLSLSLELDGRTLQLPKLTLP